MHFTSIVFQKPFFSNFGAICTFAILGTFITSIVTGILVWVIDSSLQCYVLFMILSYFEMRWVSYIRFFGRKLPRSCRLHAQPFKNSIHSLSYFRLCLQVLGGSVLFNVQVAISWEHHVWCSNLSNRSRLCVGHFSGTNFVTIPFFLRGALPNHYCLSIFAR